MRPVIKLLLFGAALFNGLVTARLFKPQDVVTLPRPGAASLSPNGTFAVYAQSTYHADQDKSVKNLFLLNLQTSSVSELTPPSFDSAQNEPFFLDDSHVAYVQNGQIHVINLDTTDKPYQLTDFPVDIANVKYNLQSKMLAFSAAVYDDGTLEGAKEREDHLRATKKDTALAYDKLMVRHWDAFTQEKQNNIFTVNVEDKEGRYQLANEVHNVLKYTGLQSPGFPSGDASDYDISPDGKHVAFVSKISSTRNAWETAQYVYIAPSSADYFPKAINNQIPAASSHPVYSSSGLLAYLQMSQPQYESDRNQIVIYNPATSTKQLVAKDWDRSPSQIMFSADEQILYAVAQEFGRDKVFAINISDDTITTLTEEGAASIVGVLPDGNLLLSISSMQHPSLLHTLDPKTRHLKMHPASDKLMEHLSHIDFLTPEEFVFEGSLGDKVHGWLIKPSNFDENQKYPVAFLIHGGPQSAWADSWSTRWNPQVFAGAGFVVVAINPHGSTGYGQKFTDSIQRNWGSYPYWDLEKGLDYVLSTYKFVDADRVAGLGASYGGYMINWINGHSNRFRALVNHDGMFSTLNSYYTTDELYFPEREFGGPPYHPLNRLVYERWSPSNFVQKWRTPTLVIHG
ncbi:Alpha/Beta hydrolase protein [Radiomyces spectabilis]|uniref:Alpha/Beta hydrolase protein n=1 Tax=Radiomyces spectabilis TaxID=64574 RepID=UPI00221F2F87|nr:Alpha/Beta hydrolase protein [Radiomyces spectabilis]KAI8365910.1 Alpha/Beta hydrolase protein [Radiomyces spectabilis]